MSAAGDAISQHLRRNICACSSASRSAVSAITPQFSFPDIGPATLPPSGQGFEAEPAVCGVYVAKVCYAGWMWYPRAHSVLQEVGNAGKRRDGGGREAGGGEGGSGSGQLDRLFNNAPVILFFFFSLPDLPSN